MLRLVVAIDGTCDVFVDNWEDSNGLSRVQLPERESLSIAWSMHSRIFTDDCVGGPISAVCTKNQTESRHFCVPSMSNAKTPSNSPFTLCPLAPVQSYLSEQDFQGYHNGQDKSVTCHGNEPFVDDIALSRLAKMHPSRHSVVSAAS